MHFLDMVHIPKLRHANGIAEYTSPTPFDSVQTTDTPTADVVSLCTSAIFTLEYGFDTAQNVCSPPNFASPHRLRVVTPAHLLS